MTTPPLDNGASPVHAGGRSEASPPAKQPTKRGAAAWGVLGSLIVIGTAVIFALPRVPAVFSYRGFPQGVTSAADRDVVPETRLEPQTYFPDPDDYTRVYRAKKIASGEVRRWGRMDEINAPDGVQLHWTAPMDYLTAAAGLLGAKWAASGEGFDIGAALLPVAMGVAYLCILIWFVRRISCWPAAILCGLVAAVSPAFHRIFEPGHPDHHCLLELLLVASIALMSVADSHPSRRSAAFLLSGGLMGLAIWTAWQAIFFWIVLHLAILITAWRARVERQRAAIFEARLWTWGAFFVTALGYLLDSREDLGTTTLDRLGALHVGLLFIAVLLVRAIFPEAARPKLGIARRMDARWTVICILIVGAMLFFRRATLFEHLQGEVLDRWHAHIAELQAMIAFVPVDAGLLQAQDYSLAPLHQRLGYTIYLLPLTLPFFLLCRRMPGVIRGILGVLAPLIAGLSLVQLRWMDHYNTFVLPAITVGLWVLLDRMSRWINRRSGPSPDGATGSSHGWRSPRRPEPVDLAPRNDLRPEGAAETRVEEGRLEHRDEHPSADFPCSSHGNGVGARWRLAIAFVILAASTIPFSTYERLATVRRAKAAIDGRDDTGDRVGSRSALSTTADLRLTEQWHTPMRALGPREDQLRTDFVARTISLHEAESPSPEGRRAILCDEGEGPTLLYETGLPVVAAPYHRAIEGIAEMMQFFAERDPLRARERLDRLSVRYIVVPYRINEQLMHYEKIAFGEPRSFDPPREWLDERGRLHRELAYRDEVKQTAAYRLAMWPHEHGIPGVEMLYGIRDDPARPDDVHGLLFVVNEIAEVR